MQPYLFPVLALCGASLAGAQASATTFESWSSITASVSNISGAGAPTFVFVTDDVETGLDVTGSAWADASGDYDDSWTSLTTNGGVNSAGWAGPGIGFSSAYALGSVDYLLTNDTGADFTYTLSWDMVASYVATISSISDAAFASGSIGFEIFDENNHAVYVAGIGGEACLAGSAAGGHDCGSLSDSFFMSVSESYTDTVAAGSTRTFQFYASADGSAISDTAVVPLPAGLPLLGGALALLGLIRRRVIR